VFDDQLASPTAPTDTRVLYLRWRPRKFEDVVGQDHVTRTLRNAVKLARPSHAYLFTGPRGTGKTTVARILYRAVNCEHAEDGDPCNSCPLCRAALDGRALDLVEIDAASNRGIDDIRDLRDKVAYRPGEGRYRLYIVDEAHELTNPAWDAFLKTLEEPPPHAIFVLATTEAHKVPPTIISRCQRFDFRRIPFQATRDQLERVAAAEGMQVEPAVLERLALVARGGLRDALSLLDQLAAFAGGQVDMTMARAALSLPSIEAVRGVLDGMTRRDPSTVMAVMSDVSEGGADLRLFAEELVVHLRALLLLRTGADTRLTDELPTDEVAWLRERAPAWSVGTLMRLVQTLSEALARTRDAQQFQVQTEVALLTACDVEAFAAPLAPANSPSPTPPPPATPAPVAEPTPSAPRAAAPAPVAKPPASVSAQDVALRDRWPDVIDQVKGRNPILASFLRSAHPMGLEDNLLVVAFSTDFNRRSAEKATHTQLIEAAFERVYGTAYRLRCTVRTEAGGGSSLLDDPVINYAARTFGGQPKRVTPDQEL
jgi:DNA polymerase III subunit gamma/tau